MRNLTATICLSASLLILGACGHYEKGDIAYNEGDYTSALSVFQPLAQSIYQPYAADKGFESLFYLDDDVLRAQVNLGVMYNKGQGIPQNFEFAVKWFRIAAEKGYAVAQYNLGVLYRDGLGVAQDNESALEWLKLAAQQGNAAAQLNLGVMYREVVNDYVAALKWTKLAAEQGLALAQYNLGVMYDQGIGPIQDDKISVKWYRLAAEQGNADAQTNLGVMYGMGRGLIQDVVYAHMWGNIGASKGNENGGKVRDLAATQMTPSQLEKAQDLARECVRKNYKGC
jgi:TPR repeat protein